MQTGKKNIFDNLHLLQPGIFMGKKIILVWFRNDLRIHDNEILLEACRRGDYIVPVYCFDPRQFENTSYKSQKTGAFRTKFILESVAGLQHSLQQYGANLVIKTGKPEEVLPQLVKKYDVTEVYHHREVAAEETEISAHVEAALWKIKINLKHFIGHTLYHKEDLPFPIKDIPDTFATFRKKVERDSAVRPCYDTPTAIRVPENLEPGILPDITDLDQQLPVTDPRTAFHFIGGESQGLKRLHEYFWDKDALRCHKQAHDGLTSADNSSKLSPWIALGCLSPRQVYWEIKKYEKERIANESTYLLVFELLWRDYFRFMFKKHGNRFFHKTGFKGISPPEAANQDELLALWKNARTGVPFIDANMREMNLTGYMSNRGRQNVASFLVKNLQVDWTLGAAYFEEKLIDYDPSSNWGNWAYIAGVGNDPKESRNFNVLKQAREYDPQGDYVRLWT